jgi:hypothetical protein
MSSTSSAGELRQLNGAMALPALVAPSHTSKNEAEFLPRYPMCEPGPAPAVRRARASRLDRSSSSV